MPQVKSSSIPILNTNGLTKPSCQRIFESVPEIANGIKDAMTVAFYDDVTGNEIEAIVFDQQFVQNNINMILPAALLSKSWSFDDLDHYSSVGGYDILSLMYKVLYEDDPAAYVYQPQWEDIIMAAPTDFNPHRGYTQGNWRHSTQWQHPKRPQLSEQWGFFNGVDFMLTYNLYRLAFTNTSNGNPFGAYTECSCDNGVTQNISFQETDSENNSWTLDLKWNGHKIMPTTVQSPTVTTVTGYHTSYKELGINTYDYFANTNYNINNGGKVIIKGTTKLCGNNVMELGSTGELILGTGNVNEEGILYVTRNTTLNLEADGILTINNNSRVIIEEGALLSYHPNTIIQLNGENAVLEIRGKLDILAGATFQTSGTGHVLFNIQNPDPSIAPDNVAGTPTSQLVFESTANPKPLKFVVANGTVLAPQSIMQLFKVDGVYGIIGENAQVFLQSEFQIQNSIIEGTGGYGFIFATLNFTPNIHHNEFVGGKNALSFIGKDNGRDIKIRYNTFQSVLNTIVMYDHSAHIAGNSFIDNCGGVFAGGHLNYLVPPTQGGLYKGRLRMELNRLWIE